MAVQEYTYAVATDFPNGRINPSTLMDEIVASPDITIQLNDVHCSGFTEEDGGVCVGGTVHIVFAAELSASEKTVLDGDTTGPCGGLIAAHDNSGKYDVPPIAEMTMHEVVLTRGRFCGKGTEIESIGEVAGEWTDLDRVFPFDVDMLSAKFCTFGQTPGDRFSVEIHPGLQILQAYGFQYDVKVAKAYTAGADVVEIELTNVGYPVALGVLDIGFSKYIKFADHGQEYWIYDYDPITNIIKIRQKDNYELNEYGQLVDKGLANDLSIGDAVKFTTIMMDNMAVPASGEFKCGDSKVGASGLPAGMMIRLKYFNKNGDAGKAAYFGCETLGGKPVT